MVGLRLRKGAPGCLPLCTGTQREQMPMRRRQAVALTRHQLLHLEPLRPVRLQEYCSLCGYRSTEDVDRATHYF